MKPIRMALVGGFLGAGKTTLLANAGKRLAARGLNVGFITNDQAADLVDTALLKETGIEVKEVAGACFCCKFDDLISRTEELYANLKPDVLLSEPVGSCTDLSATVLQPIKRFFGERFRVAPFTVVVDPTRLKELFSGVESIFSSNVMYVYSKQLEEADVILLNKIDQLSETETAALLQQITARFPNASAMAISGLNGTGLDAWLDVMLSDRPSGKNILEIDYDRYADGEAVLGWLNASVKLNAGNPKAWREFAFELLRTFKAEFKTQNAEIAHLKLFLNADGTGLVGNLTSTRGMPFVMVTGKSGDPTNAALLILNARVHGTPQQLRATVERVLNALPAQGIQVEVVNIECFSPGRPMPTHRLKAEV